MAQTITTRRVKSRFSKKHLIKLVGEMLKWTTTDRAGNKIQRLEFRPGWTAEKVAENVGLESVEEVHWERGKFKYHTINVTGYSMAISARDGHEYKCMNSKPVKFHLEDSDGHGVWAGPSYKDDDYQKYLDMWIMGDLMRRDRFFKDHSAIAIVF